MNQFLRIVLFILWRNFVFGNVNAPNDQVLENLIKKYELKRASNYIDSVLELKAIQKEPKRIYYLIKKSEYLSLIGNHENALTYADLALDQQNILGIYSWEMDAKLAKAFALNPLGRYEEVLSLARSCLSQAEKEKRIDILRKCYLQLGGVSLVHNNLDEAYNYYQIAYKFGQEAKMAHVKQIDLINLATANIYKGQLEKGILLLQEGIESAEMIKDSVMQSVGLALMGYVYTLKGDTISWNKIIQKMLKIATSIDHKKLISYGYSQLMEYELKAGNTNMALEYGRQAKELFKKQPYPLMEVYVDSVLSEAFKMEKNYKKSLEYFTSFHQNKSTILSQKQKKELEELKDKFTIKEKNLVIENQKLNLENANKRNLILILVNSVLLLIIALGLGHKWIKKRYVRSLYDKEKLLDSIIEIENRNKDLENIRFNSNKNFSQINNESHTEQINAIQEDRRELFDEMMRLIEIEKLYLNPNLDLKFIISALGTNKFYLYQAMSQYSEENFRNLINRYRVDAAKKLIESACKEGNLDIQTSSIFHDAGFNSIASFYRIFKTHTGLTPNEYKAEFIYDLEHNKMNLPDNTIH